MDDFFQKCMHAVFNFHCDSRWESISQPSQSLAHFKADEEFKTPETMHRLSACTGAAAKIRSRNIR